MKTDFCMFILDIYEPMSFIIAACFHTINGQQHVIVSMRTFFSFKENDDEEIINDTRDNDYISRKVTHLLDEKLTKGKLYYVFV